MLQLALISPNPKSIGANQPQIGANQGGASQRPDQQDFLKINAELSQKWPVITEMKEAPADADEWKEVSGKLDHLER